MSIHKELLRKLVHLFELPIIGVYTFLYFKFSPQIATLALTGLLLILIKIEYLRIDFETEISMVMTRVFSKLFNLRRKERNNVISAIFFITSTIICFSAFDYQIALLALLLTIFGDLAAALMGISFGKKKIFRSKTYVGSASGLAVNLLMGFLVLPQFPGIFLVMALTATVVETLTQKLDDNLTVPLFAGFIGQMMVMLQKIDLPPLF